MFYLLEDLAPLLRKKKEVTLNLIQGEYFFGSFGKEYMFEIVCL